MKGAILCHYQKNKSALPEITGTKLFKYHNSGVREYWIVNPASKTVNVYDFENDETTNQYDFETDIPSAIYPDLSIRISELLAE